MKRDAGSAVCVYKRRGEPGAAAPRLLRLQRHHPSLVSGLQTCFLQRSLGGGGGVLVERSVPFLCGEAVLGNYKRSCFKTGIPMNLLKQAISLLAFFFFIQFLSCCSFSGYFPD